MRNFVKENLYFIIYSIIRIYIAHVLDEKLEDNEDNLTQNNTKNYLAIKDDIAITKEDVVQGLKLVGISLFFVLIFVGILVIASIYFG